MVFNLLNPKAYAAFFAVFSQFSLNIGGPVVGLAITAAICLVVALVVDSLWLALGSGLRPVLTSPRTSRILRVSLAILMVVAVAMGLATSF